MRRFIFVAFLGILSLNLSFSGAFKDLGHGARAVSLGIPYIAVADNPYAIFYNPAGIAQLRGFGFASTYSRLYPFVEGENLQYVTLSSVIPVFSFFDFGAGITYFKAGLWSENQFVLSFSGKILKSFYWGGDVKFLRWSASAPPGESGYSYFGFTFDAGVILNLSDFIKGSDIRFGFSVKNITRPSISVNKSDDAKLPIEFAGAIVYVSRNYNYLVGLGFSRSENNFKVEAGLEILAFTSNFFDKKFELLLRSSGGFDVKGTSQGSLNPGIGLRYWKFSIDYAYVYQFEIPDAGASHKFSIEFNF
ncbi:hypothetical protein JGI1_01366 [Candidatus Thermokryptus mobilis]|uniref:PorV/PorQ family protein n=1 Tax=Candidatus Thermokryptus mobilis TaxID=1643428 RepID=A0A0S4N4I7_9BACT|nr:hypothetical protein [Candidatus Thermokryptus mobilis]CUU05925.1 hypothetical protein JGI1_01366 [Candidatus Thermokryptus mobilis]